MPVSGVAPRPAVVHHPDAGTDGAQDREPGGFTFAGVRYHMSAQAPKDARSSPFFASYCRAASLAGAVGAPDAPQDMGMPASPDEVSLGSGSLGSGSLGDDDWEGMALVDHDAGDAAAALPSGGMEFAAASRAGVREVPDATTRDRWRALCAEKGSAVTKLRFLAAHVNPNWLIGYLRNALHYGGALLRSPATSPPGVLNRNCVYCAKAVDLSLARERAEANDPVEPALWFASGTEQGSLAYLHGASGIAQGVFLLGAATSLTEALFHSVPRNARAIVCLPVIGHAGVTHALNAVHLADGSRYLVDGQRGRVYDVDRADDRERLQASFGVTEAQADLDVAIPVRYYVTGAAPRWTRAA